jgi:hypothetical protein
MQRNAVKGVKLSAKPPGKYRFYDNANTHIITYDPSKVSFFLAPVFQPDLTACYSFTKWIQHMGYVLYAVTLMIVLGEFAFPDGVRGDRKTCAAGLNVQMCQLNSVLMDSKQEFRFLIAFVLSGYVGLSITKWTQRRNNFSKLCGKIRNLTCLINSVLPNSEYDEGVDMNQIRVTANRWCMLAFELSVLKGRGMMDSDEGRQYLTNRGVLMEGEWELMCPGDRHSTVFYWLTHLFYQLCHHHNHLSANIVSTVVELLLDARGVANDLMSNVDRDQAFSYTALCGVLVNVNVMIMSTWKGVEWAIWYRAFGNDVTKQPKLWVDIAVLFFWNVSYVALYDLGYMLHNPFGNRRIDIPVAHIAAGLNKFNEHTQNPSESHVPPILTCLPQKKSK